MLTFGNKEDAIRLANATELGLAGYFFTKDIIRAMRTALKLLVGTVGVNASKI